jgi:hypothetical protein
MEQLGQSLIIVVTGFEAANIAFEEVDEVSHYHPPPPPPTYLAAPAIRSENMELKESPPALYLETSLLYFGMKSSQFANPPPPGAVNDMRSTRIISCAGVDT